MKRLYRLGLVALILTSCVGCDQVTKKVAKESLALSPPISLLNDSIRVEYTENPGAILGLGASLPSQARLLFSILFVGVALAATLAFAVKPYSPSLIQLAGLSLVAAGGIGNLLDRLFNYGAVVDFIRLGIGPLRTGIFNFADVAIIVGAAMLVLFSTKGEARTVTT